MIRRPLLALLFASSGLLHGADEPTSALPALSAPGTPVIAPLPVAAIPVVPTVIESAGPAEMVSTATETIFTFRDSVTVTATNLKLSCDQLVVVAKRTGDPKATLGKQENFKSLIATGHVRLLQSEREALCDRAEVLPGEDKVILTGNPATVRSSDGRYAGSGPEMVLERGQQRAVIKTPRFVLPPIKDLGPGKDKGKDTKAAPAGATPVIAPEPSSSNTITVPLPVTPTSPK